MKDINIDKLLEIFEDNDVGVYDNEYVNLYDFAVEIIETNDPSLYIKKMNDYSIEVIDEVECITLDDCVDILKKSKKVNCKNIYRQIVLASKCKNVLHKMDIMWMFSNFLNKAGIQYICGYKCVNNDGEKEIIDFYLPSINMAIEVDDEYRTKRDIIHDLRKQIWFTKLKKCDFVRVNTVDSMNDIVEVLGDISKRAISQV